MPQSMQRPAWRRSWAESPDSYTSFQSMMRTGTGRRAGSSRSVVFRKPLGSATCHLQDSGPDDIAVGVQPLGDGGLTGLQHSRVVAGQHADEVEGFRLEVLEHRGGELGAGL